MRKRNPTLIFFWHKNGQRLKKLRSTMYAAIFLITVSGCAITTSTLQPDTRSVDLPSAFTASGERQTKPYWWQELEDGNLQVMIDRALSGNQSLKVYAQRLLQAEAIARKAGASLAPTIEGQANGGKARSRQNDTTTTSTSLLLGLAASYEIDIWGRLQATEDAALLDAQASAEDLQAAALSLAAQVANVWYRLAASYTTEDVLRQQQEVNRKGLELVRVRFNTGKIGIADLLQQKQLIEFKNGELAQQRAVSRVLENQLAVLVGVAPGMLELPARPDLVELPPLPDTGLPIDLLANRPDIRSQYLALLAKDRRVAAAVADRYPRLSLSANLNTSGTSVRDLFDNWLASLAANVVAPLLDGGLRLAEIERTEASAREQLYTYGDALLSAVGEVEDALIQEKEQRMFIESLQIQLGLATNTVQNLKDRYKQGTVDYQRILDALLTQQSLQLSMVNGHRQLIGYRIDLYRALGGKAPEIMTGLVKQTTSTSIQTPGGVSL